MANDIEQTLTRIIVEHLGVEPHRVTPEAHFEDDLGADSLDPIELVVAFEEHFGIEVTDDEADAVTTVAQALDLVRRKVAEGDAP